MNITIKKNISLSLVQIGSPVGYRFTVILYMMIET